MVVKAVFGHGVDGGKAGGVGLARAFRVLLAAVVQARAHAQLAMDGVGAPQAAAVVWREGRAVAFDLGPTAVGGEHDVAAVDGGVRNPGVVPEDFPLRHDAPSQIEFQPRGVALA